MCARKKCAFKSPKGLHKHFTLSQPFKEEKRTPAWRKTPFRSLLFKETSDLRAAASEDTSVLQKKVFRWETPTAEKKISKEFEEDDISGCPGNCRVMASERGLDVKRPPSIIWMNDAAGYFCVAEAMAPFNLPRTTAFRPSGWDGSWPRFRWSQETGPPPNAAKSSLKARRCPVFISRFLLLLLLPEPFLAGRVPELQLDFHPGLNIERARIKIHADRGVRHVAVNPVREALQQRRLPHRGVPEEDDPELVLPQSIHGMTEDERPEAFVRATKPCAFTQSPGKRRSADRTTAVTWLSHLCYTRETTNPAPPCYV